MRDVGMGQDKLHALHGAGRLQVSEPETRMGVGAAEHGGVQAALGQDVGGVAPRARDETLVFDAAHGLTHAELHRFHR